MLFLCLLTVLGMALADTGRFCDSGECPAGWRNVGAAGCIMFAGWEEVSARQVCRGLGAEYSDWLMMSEESDSANRHSLPVCLHRRETPGRKAAYFFDVFRFLFFDVTLCHKKAGPRTFSRTLSGPIFVSLQVLLMEAGAPGVTGLSVPTGVVEELRQDKDSVTVQPRPTVVETVRVITLRENSATLSPAYQVNNYYYIYI